MTGWSILAQRALAHNIVRFMRYRAKTVLTPRGKVTSYAANAHTSQKLILWFPFMQISKRWQADQKEGTLRKAGMVHNVGSAEGS
jgi:hypothetical protein